MYNLANLVVSLPSKQHADNSPEMSKATRPATSTHYRENTVAIEITGGNKILTAETSDQVHLSLEMYTCVSEGPSSKGKYSSQLWVDSSASGCPKDTEMCRIITAALPLDLEHIILGFGRLLFF